MATETVRETHLMATAFQIAEVLGKSFPNVWARERVGQDGTVRLTNAEARRLLALAEKGVQS